MKRFLLIILLMAVTLPSWSKDFTTEQRNLLNDLVSFLKVEGFMPEIDSDEDIKFKSEGKTFYISVSDVDSSPMYISLFLAYIYDSTYTKEKILAAQQEINFYKGVKIICYDESYSMKGEVYLNNSEHFKYIFYKLLSQIKNMSDELEKICEG